MAKLHVLDGGGGQYQIVVHGPVMTGNNSAGHPWPTVIVNSGRNTTSMPVGTGVGHISAAEAAGIENGTIIEGVFSFTEDPTQTNAQRAAELDYIATQTLAHLENQLMDDLKWFGVVRS